MLWSKFIAALTLVPCVLAKPINFQHKHERTQKRAVGDGSYYVVSGDTGSSIAACYSITFTTLNSANPNVNWNSLQVGQTLKMPSSRTPLVVLAGPGDSQSSIARTFNIYTDDLANANPNVNWNSLAARTRIRVPGYGSCTTYSVTSGDYGYAIASAFSVSFDSLSAANPGVNWNNLQIGQVLVVPAGVSPVKGTIPTPVPASRCAPSATTSTSASTVLNSSTSTSKSTSTTSSSVVNPSTTSSAKTTTTSTYTFNPTTTSTTKQSTTSSVVLSSSTTPTIKSTTTSSIVSSSSTTSPVKSTTASSSSLSPTTTSISKTLPAITSSSSTTTSSKLSSPTASSSSPTTTSKTSSVTTTSSKTATTTTSVATGEPKVTPTTTVTGANYVTGGNNNDGVSSRADSYTFYQGDGSTGKGWPSQSQWISFATMWKNISPYLGQSCLSSFGVANNSPQENQYIYNAIQAMASNSGVDHRLILATIIQESSGCVRVKTTVSPDGTVTNPGLMQTYNGSGSCNRNGNIQNPCPASQIYQMIADGTFGTSTDGGKNYYAGLVQDINSSPNYSGAQVIYRATRIYNSGSMPSSNDLGAPGATRCYASDMANRLMGWISAKKTCTLDG